MPQPVIPILKTLFAALLVLLSACSTNSTITHEYVDPKAHTLDLEGVLIVGVAQKKSARVEFEDAFAKSLGRQGVRAIASHTLVANQKAEAEVFVAAAEKEGLDTILVTRYVGESVEEVYHPGTVYYGVMPAYGGRYNRGGFGGYYGHAYEVAYQQPVWTANRTYTLISDLFATESKEHLWQAVSDTVQSGSNDSLRDDVIKSFVSNLKDQGLL
jgi:hypothetical protein